MANDDQQHIAFFEALHNLLWNDAGLDPQKALEHMTFFFAYRLIEPQVEALGLPECCKWSFMASQESTQEIFDVMKQAINKFRTNPQTKPYFNPPSINKAALIQRIVEKIDELDIEALRQTDTLGSIFEYMLGRGMSTMSDEGQYFTNRKICNLAFELAYSIKGTVRREDGSLCTFADFFCGTGGFASAYVNGVKKVDPNVNWSVDKESIYCLDKNLSSVQTTLLNMLILTGVPFNIDKIKEHNSFQNNIVHQGTDTAGFFGEEFDYLFMNPPYGGDKTKGKQYRFKYTTGKGKDKQYLVNKEIQSIGIEDDDKVSAGIQLAMATLSKNGGVCCIVLPQGFFFGRSKKLVELRKRLIEEYKVHYVVDIASGEFVNTGTKTSMLVFQAYGNTDIVRFIDPTASTVQEVTVDIIASKSFVLSHNVYSSTVPINISNDFQLMYMRDIVSATKYPKHPTSYGNSAGKYRFHTGADTTRLYCDSYDITDEVIIINRTNGSGKCHIYMDKQCSVATQTITFSAKQEVCVTSYLYHYLCVNKVLLENLYVGGNHKNLSIESLNELHVILPSLEIQKQIVEPIDNWMGVAQAEERALEQLEKAVMSQIRVMGMSSPRVKLEDILVQQKGKKYNVSDGNDKGEYPLIQSSKDGKCKWLDTYTFEGSLIVVGTGGIANIHLKEKFNISTEMLVFGVKTNALLEYIYYQLKLSLEYINTALFQGTTLKHLNRKGFLDMHIPLPPLEEQQSLQKVFDEIKNKKEMIKYYKKQAQEYIDKNIPKC